MSEEKAVFDYNIQFEHSEKRYNISLYELLKDKGAADLYKAVQVALGDNYKAYLAFFAKLLKANAMNYNQERDNDFKDAVITACSFNIAPGLQTQLKQRAKEKVLTLNDFKEVVNHVFCELIRPGIDAPAKGGKFTSDGIVKAMEGYVKNTPPELLCKKTVSSRTYTSHNLDVLSGAQPLAKAAWSIKASVQPKNAVPQAIKISVAVMSFLTSRNIAVQPVVTALQPTPTPSARSVTRTSTYSPVISQALEPSAASHAPLPLLRLSNVTPPAISARRGALTGTEDVDVRVSSSTRTSAFN